MMKPSWSELTSWYQAEYTRIPYANFNLIKIPDSVPDEEALYLSDILATSYHQVMDTGVAQGDVVGIWGVSADAYVSHSGTYS